MRRVLSGGMHVLSFQRAVCTFFSVFHDSISTTWHMIFQEQAGFFTGILAGIV
jgi:hypothetical protein